MTQHVPEWHATYEEATATAAVSFIPVEEDPVAVVNLDGYSTVVLAGTGNVEVLVAEDGEVPDEYWAENIDAWECGTEAELDERIADEVTRVKEFIAKLERVGPTEDGRALIRSLQNSITEDEIAEAKTSLMEYVEEAAQEAAQEATYCTGVFYRHTGSIEHSGDCPVHGKTIEF